MTSTHLYWTPATYSNLYMQTMLILLLVWMYGQNKHGCRNGSHHVKPEVIALNLSDNKHFFDDVLPVLLLDLWLLPLRKPTSGSTITVQIWKLGLATAARGLYEIQLRKSLLHHLPIVIGKLSKETESIQPPMSKTHFSKLDCQFYPVCLSQLLWPHQVHNIFEFCGLLDVEGFAGDFCPPGKKAKRAKFK